MESGPQQRLDEIFSDAVEIPEGHERRAFLDRACGADGDLRRRVEALILADQGAKSLPPPPETTTSPPSEPCPGQRIGRFRILELIGEGGCGSVYHAEQEEPVRRRVALKVIKAGMDSRQVIARFEAERQALARMDHPHIARVLEAGTLESGRPYFVMELVRGLPITEYCDSHGFDTHLRLELFIKVCHAVQHAHQKGVVHRDLKPSNILVTEIDGSPVPKIIDFGIAKAVEGRLVDQTFFTAFHQFLGTPAYMSPEQASMSGTDIDTRSDIYSLGVLLYELLTGRPPFDTKSLLSGGLAAMCQTIRETDPIRPSARLKTLPAADLAVIVRCRRSDAQRIHQTVRGDLDWIVMKCLAKERNGRYASANGLAMDLQRHLASEPVLARPPSLANDVLKAIRRHRVGFAAACAVLLALLLGTTVATVAYLREQTAHRSVAQRAYIEAMRVAQQQLRDGNVGEARERLRLQLPAAGGPDLRNWEWRQLAFESRNDPHHQLTGHVQRVSNVRFLGNHHLLTTGRSQMRTFVWDLDSRTLLHAWTNRSTAGGIGHLLALTPDGRRAFVCPAWPSTAVDAIDLDTGKETFAVGTLAAPSLIQGLHVSPDGRFLAVAGVQSVECWDAVTLQRIATLPGCAGGVRFSPDSKTVFAADPRGGLRRFKVDASSTVESLPGVPGPSSPVNLIRLSADGRWLATRTEDDQVQVRRLDDLATAIDVPHPPRVSDVAITPDGQWLAIAGESHEIHLFDPSQSRRPVRLRGHSDLIQSLDFSPDGAWLASSSRNGEVMLWQLSLQRPTSEDLRFDEEAHYTFLAPDGSGFVRVLQHPERPTDTVEFWSAPDLRPLARREIARLPKTRGTAARLLPGARQLVVGHEDGTLRLLDRDGIGDRILPTIHNAQVYALSVSPDGRTLLSQSVHAPGTGAGWHTVTWRLPDFVPATSANLDWGLDAAISEASASLATLDGAGGLTFYDLPKLDRPEHSVLFAPAESYAYAYSRDGRQFAVVCNDGNGRIFEIPARTPRVTLSHLPARVSSVSFSADGSRLAIGTASRLQVVETSTGETVWTATLDDLPLAVAAFSPTDQNLVAVGPTGARVFHAPPLAGLDDDWLTTDMRRSSRR